MAHYAEIVNSTVTRILVADEEFIVTLPGTWVQTSYNTRGGIHYGNDGKPDGKPALRKNFAAVGYIYDEQRDAFYCQRPTGIKYCVLNEFSCIWEPVLPNKTVYVDAMEDGFVKEDNKIFITDFTRRSIGRLTIDNLQQSLGVMFTNNQQDAKFALSSNDSQVLELCTNQSLAHLAPMSAEAFNNVTDRSAMQNLGVPVLPSWVPKNEAELLALPNIPIFIKKAKTYFLDTSQWAYREFASPQAFSEVVDSSFWDIQNSTDDDNYVIQPAITAPFTDLDIFMSVNNKSEVYVFSAMETSHDSPKKLGNQLPLSPASDDVIAVVEAIKNICLSQKITSGLHEIQFAKYNNEWVLLDWNARLTGAVALCFPTVYPVLDDAILHMMGRPLRGRAENLYTMQKSCRELNIPTALNDKIMSMGIFPRYDRNEPDFIARVALIGQSKDEVDERLKLFDGLLQTLNNAQ